MPVILITNDDGIAAEGLKALFRELSPMAEVYIVAPDRERSASGRSLTLHKPLRVQKTGERSFSVSGTPTDCVAVGVEKILPARPDVVVSGINNGPNLGDDITYSGTVSAAMEATVMNIPSLAVSLNVGNGEKAHFATAARVAASLIHHVLEHALPFDTLLNVNVPNIPLEEVAGFRLTRHGKRIYEGAIHETVSPWGEVYYWIGGGVPYWEHGEDTDIQAVLGGYVSVTPLHLDLTNYKAMDFLRRSWEPWITRDKGSAW
ncbi:MAG: 5'/3'-nucleotidase SurE [Nitrospirota bacterium]|jgi:5'-nucleotidase